MIRLKSTGRHPNILLKKWNGLLFGLRQALIREVEVVEGVFSYRFRCGNLREYSRCVKMFIKEPGTCEWIDREVKSGDVFYDIGANIGVYSIMAARRVGETGRVFAFEPHSGNFSRLLSNIVENNLQHIVLPCNIALNDEDGFSWFNYVSSQAGQSSSQLGPDGNGSSTESFPEISELKYVGSIDSLINSGKFEKPHHVKIDVDGNEFRILRGMSRLLKGLDSPRSIQVETDTEREAAIESFLEAYNYALTDKHYTRSVMKRKAKAMHLKSHQYNGIFRPAGNK